MEPESWSRSLRTHPRKKRNFDDSESDVENAQSRAKRCKLSESPKRLMEREKVHGKAKPSSCADCTSDGSEGREHEEGRDYKWREFQKSEVFIPLETGVNVVSESDGRVPRFFNERGLGIGVDTRIFPYVRY